MSAVPAEGARSLLACPLCKDALAAGPGLLRCLACGEAYPQARDDCLDLLPRRLRDEDRTDWERRQDEMEESYRELLRDPDLTVLGYRNDYGPFAPLLTGYDGQVLDVGGGNGVARHYLPAQAKYVVVDPSLDWLRPEWGVIAHAFPCLRQAPCFVRGAGEYLPFRSRAFDAALSFWSLNHASRPEALIAEVRRVLRPGGRFLVVLEEMAPRWRDLLDGAFPWREPVARLRAVPRKLWSLAAGWPIQGDHVRILEAHFMRWIADGFVVLQRSWIGAYLAYELRTTAEPGPDPS